MALAGHDLCLRGPPAPTDGVVVWGRSPTARRGRVSMDTPVSLGILGTFIVSTGVTFGNQDLFGHEAYFDSLTMFVTFLLAVAPGAEHEGNPNESA